VFQEGIGEMGKGGSGHERDTRERP